LTLSEFAGACLSGKNVHRTCFFESIRKKFSSLNKAKNNREHLLKLFADSTVLSLLAYPTLTASGRVVGLAVDG